MQVLKNKLKNAKLQHKKRKRKYSDKKCEKKIQKRNVVFAFSDHFSIGYPFQKIQVFSADPFLSCENRFCLKKKQVFCDNWFNLFHASTDNLVKNTYYKVKFSLSFL